MNIPVVCQVSGLVMIAVGAFLLWGWGVAVIVAGSLAVIAGIALEHEHSVTTDLRGRLEAALRQIARES